MAVFSQMSTSCSFLLSMFALAFLGTVQTDNSEPPTAPPIFDGFPYALIWNMVTSKCKTFKIPLDTSPFQAVTTPNPVPDQFLFLFYTNRLGIYPYVNEATKQEFNGGIPQKGNLTASLLVAEADIAEYMPSETTLGLAVIDWEAWRPQWARNWDSKAIYRTLSIEYARQLDPSLSPATSVPVAKEQFQAAARNFMEDTMGLGIERRPDYHWGFYLFPECYNDQWEEPGYTGACPTDAMNLNDELLWLWKASTALYPSVYLNTNLGDSHKAALYVRNQVHEAKRVAALPGHPYTAPIYVYTRPIFTNQHTKFLSKTDLINTLGENAAVGASGSVLWGGTTDFDNKDSCEALSSYLTSTLNPYITNITAAAKLCSDSLCQGNGRCVRKDYNSDDYLHLNAASFTIQKAQHKHVATGNPSASDLAYFADRFTCQCYAGKACTPKLPAHLPKTPVVIEVGTVSL